MASVPHHGAAVLSGLLSGDASPVACRTIRPPQVRRWCWVPLLPPSSDWPPQFSAGQQAAGSKCFQLEPFPSSSMLPILLSA